MARKPTPEVDHEFVLVLTGVDELTTDVENSLYEAGCDDATISVRYGRVFLTFARRAASLKAAILSAIREIVKADIGAEVLRIEETQLVTQADIARKIGRSRQLVHQYLTGVRGPDGFPPPISSTGDAVLWSWPEVAMWLRDNDMITEDACREAQEVAVINSVLDWQRQRRAAPKLTKEVMAAVDG